MPVLIISPDKTQPVSSKQASPLAPGTLLRACERAHQVAARTRPACAAHRQAHAYASSSSIGTKAACAHSLCVGLLTGTRPSVGHLVASDAQTCSLPTQIQHFKQHANQARTDAWVTLSWPFYFLQPSASLPLITPFIFSEPGVLARSAGPLEFCCSMASHAVLQQTGWHVGASRGAVLAGRARLAAHGDGALRLQRAARGLQVLNALVKDLRPPHRRDPQGQRHFGSAGRVRGSA